MLTEGERTWPANTLAYSGDHKEMRIYHSSGMVVGPSVPFCAAHFSVSSAAGISIYSLITQFSVIANTCPSKNEEKV